MRFPHSLAYEAKTYGARTNGQVPEDAVGLPVLGAPEVTLFRGWLQPNIARQGRPSGQDADESEGLAFSTHTVFAPMSMSIMRKGGSVRWEPFDGRYYVLASDPNDAAGMGHHLEVACDEYRYGTES